MVRQRWEGGRGKNLLPVVQQGGAVVARVQRVNHLVRKGGRGGEGRRVNLLSVVQQGGDVVVRVQLVNHLVRQRWEGGRGRGKKGEPFASSAAGWCCGRPCTTRQSSG